MKRTTRILLTLISVIVCLAAGDDITASAQSLKNRTWQNQTKQTKPKKKSGKKTGKSGNSGSSSSSTQQHLKPYLYIDGSAYSPTYTFTENGGGKYATISTNQTPFIASSYPSWIHPEITGNKLYIKIEPNRSSIARTGTFSLGAGNKRVTIYVKQDDAAQYEPYLYVDDNSSFVSYTLPNRMSSIYPTISTNQTAFIESMTYCPSWIHPKISNNKLSITVDSNNSSSSRTGKLIIGAGAERVTIHIEQVGK